MDDDLGRILYGNKNLLFFCFFFVVFVTVPCGCVWPKVNNHHGGNRENIKPKSTTKVPFSAKKQTSVNRVVSTL